MRRRNPNHYFKYGDKSFDARPTTVGRDFFERFGCMNEQILSVLDSPFQTFAVKTISQ
jgi:hypothetical protein